MLFSGFTSTIEDVSKLYITRLLKDTPKSRYSVPKFIPGFIVNNLCSGTFCNEGSSKFVITFAVLIPLLYAPTFKPNVRLLTLPILALYAKFNIPPKVVKTP